MAASDAAPPPASSLGMEAAESFSATPQPIFIAPDAGFSAEPEQDRADGAQHPDLVNDDYWAEQNLLSLGTSVA
jgi:hypothetical protein